MHYRLCCYMHNYFNIEKMLFAVARFKKKAVFVVNYFKQVSC